MSYIGNPIVSTDFPVDYASGNGSTTAFTLSVAPASVNSIDVQISGVSQSPQTYSVSGTTLTFSAAPPTGTNNIVVRHLGIAGIPNTPSAASVTQDKLASNIAGTGPSFRVYLSSNQTVSSSTLTKITLNAETFDTNSNFDSTTNYRFTPTVAGYYQFNVTLGCSAATALTYNYIQIFKNGVSDSVAIYPPYQSTSSYGSLATLIYLNGTTDYVELYVTLLGTGTLTVTGGAQAASTYMSGYLAKAA